MVSNFDWEWPATQKRRPEDERKKMQEAFEHFQNSKEWGMICMIYEADDCFDIVIRDEEKISCRCLHGEVWEKAYLTPEQLKSIQEKQQDLQQEKKMLPAEEQSEKTYQWGIICRDSLMRICKDGIVRAHSPEEAERKLRLGELHRNAGITVFY